MHKTLHKGSWVIKCAAGEALTEGDADTFLHMSTQTNINTQTHTLSKQNKKAMYGASDNVIYPKTVGFLHTLISLI